MDLARIHPVVCILPPQIRFDQSRHEEADQKKGGHDEVAPENGQFMDDFAHSIGHCDAEHLGRSVQKAGSCAFRCWECQLGCELEAEREVASHEETVKWKRKT